MDSTLGKRKERDVEGDEASENHGSTLFVSNLPYTATSVDLQTLFSDIAPVRSAFVVTEHGTGVSKGVGYVSFAIKEDAQSAFEQISKDGLALVGRKIRVQWADQKPKEKREKGEDSPKKEPKARPPPRPQQPRLPHDPTSIRTIIISGLPSSIDSKALWKKIRKCDGAEKVDWPVEEGSGPTAHVIFNSPSAASNAITKLHAHVFKGHLLSVALKKRLENLSKPAIASSSKGESSLKAEGSAKSAAPSRSSRLIVRNLPWNITEQDLRAVFLPYGPIHSIHIPTASPVTEEPSEGDSSPKRPARPRAKGFAFVWMLSKKDAEKAIEGCNGKTVSAGMAESLVSDKQKKKKQRREEKKLKALAAKAAQNADGEEKEDAEKEGDEEDIDEKIEEKRVIAVDWALSKDKWQEEKAKMEQEEEEEKDVDMEDVSGSESDDESDEDSHIGVHDHGDDSDEDDESQGRSEDEDEAPVKPALPPPETGNTLFVRNVPFEATEDDLRTLFRAFGPLRYARITIDPATGRSRGTGFACFWNREDADKVVTQSDLLRAETTGSTIPQPKKNPFKLPSILTPDPSSTLAQSLVLHGRTLDCVRAVTRDEAGKLKEAGEKARQKADKRNMYLLREGVILPSAPAAASLSPVEIERRTSSFNARRALLKSNPSLYISKTRLSIRQIPLFVSERALKRLAIHATKAFETEVAAGDRTALTADELAVDTTAPEEGEDHEQAEAKKDKGKKKKFGGKRQAGVKQAKIVRQAERVDAVTGKARSKGYGFLEMYSHADALRVLRWANCNPSIAALFGEWWKDEVKDLLKIEQAKKEDEKDEARVTRLKGELEKRAESLVEKKSRGNLIVEFSIENVQVVQRRNTAKVRPEKEAVEEKRKRKQDSGKSEERQAKRQKVDKATKPTEAKSPKPKAAETPKSNPVGSIIGRKRKERKAGKKA